MSFPKTYIGSFQDWVSDEAVIRWIAGPTRPDKYGNEWYDNYAIRRSYESVGRAWDGDRNTVVVGPVKGPCGGVDLVVVNPPEGGVSDGDIFDVEVIDPGNGNAPTHCRITKVVSLNQTRWTGNFPDAMAKAIRSA